MNRRTTLHAIEQAPASNAPQSPPPAPPAPPVHNNRLIIGGLVAVGTLALGIVALGAMRRVPPKHLRCRQRPF